MKDKAKGLYKEKGAAWVVAALFAFAWLGYLFQAVMMALTRHSLPTALSVAGGILATLVSIVFLLAAVASAKDENIKDAFKGFGPALGWALWLVALNCLYDFVTDKFIGKGIFTVFTKSPKSFMLFYCLICAVFCLIGGFFLVMLVSSAAGTAAGAQNLTLGTVLGAVGIALMNLLPYAGARIAALVPFSVNSVMMNFAVSGVCILIASLLFVPLVLGICRRATTATVETEAEPAITPVETSEVSETTVETVTETSDTTSDTVETTVTDAAAVPSGTTVSEPAPEPTKKSKFKKREKAAKPAKVRTSSKGSGLVVLVSGIIVFALTFGLTVFTQPKDPVKIIENDIAAAISQANLYGVSGDVLTASSYADRARAMIDAWRGAVLGEEDLLRKASDNYPAEDAIQLLYAQHFKDYSFIERSYLGSSDVSDEYLIALYDSYQNSDSAVSQARRKELTATLISRGIFNNTLIAPEKLSGRENQLANALNSLEQSMADKGLETYALLAKAPVIGSTSYDFVKYALELAEKYPDDIDLQYLAMNTGCGYQTDSGSHYKATIDAAKRYLELCKAGDRSAEELMRARLYVAGQMMLISQHDYAAELTKDYVEVNEQAASIYLSYLFDQRNYADCLEETKKALAKFPDNRLMIYQMGLCGINLREWDAYIDALLSLSSHLQKSSDAEETKKLDNSLYLLIEHGILTETSQFSTSFYTPDRLYYITEEHLARIGTDSFLKDYMDAVYYWYRGGSYSAEEKAERYAKAMACIDRVIAAKDGLPLAHYHKGVIAYQMGNDELAVTEYKNALAIDDKQPVIWYMLACTYDRMGKYQEGYEACCKVSELLPDSDHDTDVFGTGIHSERLKQSLANKIKEGK